MTKEFDAKNMAKSRAKCAEMAEAASTGKRVLTERERQILDMWPKFEDSEYVMPGDKWLYLGNPAKENTVSDVTFSGCGATLCSDIREQHIAYGERVKRPVQSVLDADGVEIKVGDTVWTLDGLEGVVTKVEDGAAYIAYESDYAQCEDAANLTHTRPDSWERFVEDMQKSSCAYFGYLHKGCDEGDGCPARGALDCGNRKMTDLIRRAKALVGVEVSE